MDMSRFSRLTGGETEIAQVLMLVLRWLVLVLVDHWIG
jgi:hypothetical protein